MTDFIDGLERDLVDAARRDHHARRAAAPSRRWRFTGRGLALALATLVLAGSATAAVVGLTAAPSKPLAGPVDAAKPSAQAYAVSLLPDLRPGQAGWCSVVRFSTGGRFNGAGMGCGPARAAGGAQIAGGGMYGNGESLQYVVVTARTRAVRFDERTLVATRSDPSLPYGWRYAVAVTGPVPALAAPSIEPPATGTPVPGPVPSRTTPGATPAAPAPAPPHVPTRTTPGVTPAAPATAPPRLPEPFVPVQYDARGRTLPATTRADDHTRQGRSRPVTRAHPAQRCVIGGAKGYVARYARVQTSPPKPAPRVEGRAFGSCASTVFRVAGKRGGLTAAILLDSHRPRAPAAALPRTPGLSGRRLGPGWIVVYGGAATDRGRLLARLRPRL